MRRALQTLIKFCLKMGKRNQKSTVIVKRSGETDERKICIGEEINRWTTVREALSLSDEELLKAMLDL